MITLSTTKGCSTPLGASSQRDGVHFAFFSPRAIEARILFFQHAEEKTPFSTLSLVPQQHKTGDLWHVLVHGLPPSFFYSYQIHLQDTGWSEELVDPYAKILSTPAAWNARLPYHPRAYFSPPTSFDWQGIKKVTTPFQEWIIYEMHVRGWSRHPSSLVQLPGTFLGVIEKIPHLKKLGVNAIELLPIFEFNECELHSSLQNPFTHEPLCNFWGYSPISFFAPMRRYSTSTEDHSPVIEFQTMVRELHRQGIAVILDVVYNHTAEQGTIGPTLSFKGLSKETYYLLDQAGEYYNFSGTGNTVNCNHPVVQQLILDSLSYWANEMQVDAFRFDLASILTRGEDGAPLLHPPLLQAIKHAPALKDTYLIAEAWDAAGLYQVGSFPGEDRWSEWNGYYRDTTRKFIKGTKGMAGAFAQVLCGSECLYKEKAPFTSINFITAHDGYTLKDLVSYEKKHNLANGEENRDGINNNNSWNCGVEGSTSNLNINALRKRQMKNFITALFISLGVPMILMGDEYGHTRQGNNNPYCQDNELNWFLWDLLERGEEKDIFLFVQKMIRFRIAFKQIFCKTNFFTEDDVSWHGKTPFQADWNTENKLVFYSLQEKSTPDKVLLIAFHAEEKHTFVQLPPPPHGQRWSQVVNTSLQSPYDFVEDPHERVLLSTPSLLLYPYSALIMESCC